MKKHRIVPILSAALALVLLCSLSGCGKKKAKTSVNDRSETTSITPAAPVLGGGESMGPLYTPEEADSAGLTSPVIPAPVTREAPDIDASGAETYDAQGAQSVDSENAETVEDATSGTDAANVETSDPAASSSAYQQGYAAGEAAGYAQGYKEGYDEGGGVGYDNGYKAGRTAGYAEIAGIVTSRIADNAD